MFAVQEASIGRSRPDVPSIRCFANSPAHCSKKLPTFQSPAPFSVLPPSPRPLQNKLQEHISHPLFFLSLLFSLTIRPCLLQPSVWLSERNVSVLSLHWLISNLHPCMFVEQYQFQIFKYLKTILSPYFITQEICS